jgi:hypothetical protein
VWGGVENEPAVHLGYLLNLVLKQAFRGVTHWWHGAAGFLGFGFFA